MADIVSNYLDKIDEISISVINDADKILEAIDLDELLQNPEEYLNALGNQFIADHKKEIQQGYDTGKRFANEVLKRS